MIVCQIEQFEFCLIELSARLHASTFSQLATINHPGPSQVNRNTSIRLKSLNLMGFGARFGLEAKNESSSSICKIFTLWRSKELNIYNLDFNVMSVVSCVNSKDWGSHEWTRYDVASPKRLIMNATVCWFFLEADLIKLTETLELTFSGEVSRAIQLIWQLAKSSR